MPIEARRDDEGVVRGRQRGRVLWKQIADALAAELVAGRYPAGSKLPTEPELMARFRVGRHTLRQAMAALEEQGLVRIEQGRGTFVHDGVVHYRISERTRFAQNLISQGREPAYKVVGIEEAPPRLDISEALGLKHNELVARIDVDSFANDVVIGLSDVYFPALRFPGVGEVYRELRSTTATYLHFGVHDYVRRATRISSRLPTPDEARRLHQPKSRPVLVTRKVDADLEGRSLSYSETRWASDRVEFVIDPSSTFDAASGAAFAINDVRL